MICLLVGSAMAWNTSRLASIICKYLLANIYASKYLRNFLGPKYLSFNRFTWKSNNYDMQYRRMPIEIEAPEGFGYDKLDCNLSESSFSDQKLSGLGISVDDLLLCYSDHKGKIELR